MHPQQVMENDDLFTRGNGVLGSASNGEVDLGCPIPSPALLLSTKTLSDTWWSHLGGEDLWKIRDEELPDVRQAARVDVETILGDARTGSMEKVQKLAESSHLCALMDAIRTAPRDRRVAVDTPLAEALAVRKHNAPPNPCHEVVVSSLHHEIKSITGYPASQCFCYPRAEDPNYDHVAVGGVCLRVTGGLGDVFQPAVPGKLVIYHAEWMTPWTALLCIIGAVNTTLMAVFLAATPWNQDFTARNPAFGFLLVNVIMEVAAIRMGWHVEHRMVMGWRRHLVRSDPFHALLTADSTYANKVQCILGLEAMGGVASVFGIAFTSGVPLEVLTAVAIPVLSSCLSSCMSKSNNVRTPLIIGAMAFYLLEFVYEIVVLIVLDDSVLGWVVILSSIMESMALVWIIATVLDALHFLSTEQTGTRGGLSDRAPARTRDGTLNALRLPDLPTCGLMGTSALGSAVLARGSFVPNGGSAIKKGTTSYRQNCQQEPMPNPAGWLSLKASDATSRTIVDRTTFTGHHAWIGDIVVTCGLAIPVLG